MPEPGIEFLGKSPDSDLIVHPFVGTPTTTPNYPNFPSQLLSCITHNGLGAKFNRKTIYSFPVATVLSKAYQD